MYVLNLGKRKTGSNKLRHRNCKKVEDRVNPISSLASADRTITVKGKDKGLQKRKRAAKKVALTAMWHLHNFDATPVAERILLCENNISHKYDYVCINNTAWYVRRQDDYLDVGSYTSKTCVPIEKSVDTPAKGDNGATRLHPWFKCVRTVKLINLFLHCTCKHYDQISIACHHILRITDFVRECFDIK